MGSEHYLKEIVLQFRKLKELAERAVEQVAEEDLFSQLDDESNSIAIIMKHMAGNMRSRWTGFLAADGDKPDRDRDSEFVIDEADTKEGVQARWEAGWQCAFEALGSLGPDDLSTTVHIRGQPLLVMEAINRALTHYAYHVGQIVLLSKHYAGAGWEALTIPRGKSEEFLAELRKSEGST